MRPRLYKLAHSDKLFAAFDFGQAHGKEPRNAGLFLRIRIEHAGTPRGARGGGDAAAPDVAKHELGMRPLLCKIAHSDKLLQRWFLAPWTMKHSACFVGS